ncbi:MAG: M20/M25/M40 family metallo-hydrolase [Myxococcota bacterium]
MPPDDDEPPSSPLHRALHEAVAAAFEPEQFPFVRRLVDQPSHTAARDDVEAASRILDEQVAALGMATDITPDPDERFADHRVYRTPATAPDDRSLAVVGHMDTVFPRSMGFLRLSRDDGPDGPETGDIIRGPGSLDMKSGLSVVVFAIAALRRVDPALYEKLRLRFICVSDEEVGSPSSKPLFAELAPRLTGALVFEAGRHEDKIVTCRKGSARFEFEVEGRSAHAGNEHHKGINAIAVLSRLVLKAEAITDYERGVTVNVGIIEGGTAKNTVPDRARCVIDSRFLTVKDAHEVVARMEALAADPFGDEPDVPERLRDAVVTLKGGIARPPMEPSEGNQALRVRYEAHAAAAGLRIGEAPLQGGGSDANLLAAHGVPSIDGLGPAGKFFHNPREWSSLDSLRRRTQALACLLAEEAQGGPR